MTVIRGTFWLALCGLLILHAWMLSERAIGQPAILHFIQMHDTQRLTDNLKKHRSTAQSVEHLQLLPGTVNSSAEFITFSRQVFSTSTRTSSAITAIREARFREARLRFVSDLLDDSEFDCREISYVLDALPFKTERQVALAWFEEQLHHCSLPRFTPSRRLISFP